MYFVQSGSSARAIEVAKKIVVTVNGTLVRTVIENVHRLDVVTSDKMSKLADGAVHEVEDRPRFVSWRRSEKRRQRLDEAQNGCNDSQHRMRRRPPLADIVDNNYDGGNRQNPSQAHRNLVHDEPNVLPENFLPRPEILEISRGEHSKRRCTDPSNNHEASVKQNQDSRWRFVHWNDHDAVLREHKRSARHIAIYIVIPDGKFCGGRSTCYQKEISSR